MSVDPNTPVLVGAAAVEQKLEDYSDAREAVRAAASRRSRIERARALVVDAGALSSSTTIRSLQSVRTPRTYRGFVNDAFGAKTSEIKELPN